MLRKHYCSTDVAHRESIATHAHCSLYMNLASCTCKKSALMRQRIYSSKQLKTDASNSMTLTYTH